MLYLIESDVIYDTVTHEREAVTKDDLYKALNLGIQIVGVRLENGTLTVYDWRLINRQKLKALRGINIKVDRDGNLITVSANDKRSIVLGDCVSNITSSSKFKGTAVYVLDDRINYYRVGMGNIDVHCVFDTRQLSLDNLYRLGLCGYLNDDKVIDSSDRIFCASALRYLSTNSLDELVYYDNTGCVAGFDLYERPDCDEDDENEGYVIVFLPNFKLVPSFMVNSLYDDDIDFKSLDVYSAVNIFTRIRHYNNFYYHENGRRLLLLCHGLIYDADEVSISSTDDFNALGGYLVYQFNYLLGKYTSLRRKNCHKDSIEDILKGIRDAARNTYNHELYTFYTLLLDWVLAHNILSIGNIDWVLDYFINSK